MLHCLFWNRKGGRDTNWYQLFYSFKLHASQSFLKVCYVTLLICILHCPTWDYFPWTISKVWADLLMFAQGRPKGKKKKRLLGDGLNRIHSQRPLTEFLSMLLCLLLVSPDSNTKRTWLSLQADLQHFYLFSQYQQQPDIRMFSFFVFCFLCAC